MNADAIKVIVDTGQSPQVIEVLKKSTEALKQEMANLGKQMATATGTDVSELTKKIGTLNAEITRQKDLMEALAGKTVPEVKGKFGQLSVEVGRFVQDFQAAGIQGVANNLEGLGRALGSAGLGGGITLAAVAFMQWGPQIKKSIEDFLSPMKDAGGLNDTLETLKDKVAALEKKSIKFTVDFQELDQAQGKLDNLKRALDTYQANIKSLEQEDLGGRASKVLRSMPGGATTMESALQQHWAQTGVQHGTQSDIDDLAQARKDQKFYERKAQEPGEVETQMAAQTMADSARARGDALQAKLAGAQQQEARRMVGKFGEGDLTAIAMMKNLSQQHGKLFEVGETPEERTLARRQAQTGIGSLPSTAEQLAELRNIARQEKAEAEDQERTKKQKDDKERWAREDKAKRQRWAHHLDKETNEAIQEEEQSAAEDKQDASKAKAQIHEDKVKAEQLRQEAAQTRVRRAAGRGMHLTPEELKAGGAKLLEAEPALGAGAPQFVVDELRDKRLKIQEEARKNQSEMLARQVLNAFLPEMQQLAANMGVQFTPEMFHDAIRRTADSIQHGVNANNAAIGAIEEQLQRVRGLGQKLEHQFNLFQQLNMQGQALNGW